MKNSGMKEKLQGKASSIIHVENRVSELEGKAEVGLLSKGQ